MAVFFCKSLHLPQVILSKGGFVLHSKWIISKIHTRFLIAFRGCRVVGAWYDMRATRYAQGSVITHKKRACALSSGKMTCTSITGGLVGWLYAAVSPCQGQRPWRARCPRGEGLYWRVPDQTEDRTQTISRTFFMGMSIPGYWDGEKHYIVKPRTKTRTSCKARCGEILDLERTAGYSWTPLVPGDAVPASGTVDGYGLDGEALVIARRVLDDDELFGYYCKFMKASYFNVEGGVAHFGTVDR